MKTIALNYSSAPNYLIVKYLLSAPFLKGTVRKLPL